jgi:PPOX class probable F420-dependent enzyme
VSGDSVGPNGGLRPDEVATLLARPILARLGTIDDDGHPSIVPVWFEWADGAFWVVARAHARYVRDVAARPQVGLSVVDDRDPDRRIQIRGRATIVGGPGPLEGDTLALARRLAERYEGADGLAYIDRSQDWARVLVRIEPLAIVTWGSPEWHGRYR